jgi:hypothetical protein
MALLAALALLVLVLPAAAQKDAAERVQEGNVNQWVEYYRKQREAVQAPPGGAPATEEAASAAGGAKEKAAPPALTR